MWDFILCGIFFSTITALDYIFFFSRLLFIKKFKKKHSFKQESAPPYEETQSGASGLVPGRPLVGPDSGSPRRSPNRSSLGDRPPPPLPSQPPNSGGSSPAGKNTGSSPAGRVSDEDTPIYDYAMAPTPLSHRPPGSYRENGGAGNAQGTSLETMWAGRLIILTALAEIE